MGFFATVTRFVVVLVTNYVSGHTNSTRMFLYKKSLNPASGAAREEARLLAKMCLGGILLTTPFTARVFAGGESFSRWREF